MNRKVTIWVVISLVILVGITSFLVVEYNEYNEMNRIFKIFGVKSLNLGDNAHINEIIKGKVGLNGGVLQNSDKSVIVTIPSLKQETEFTLSFKKSDFEVTSGVRAPIIISISPDLKLAKPISIKVKYDSRYKLLTPYLIDQNNKLRPVDIEELNKINYYFTMSTFHGGSYSWIYHN
jgi:hypothetical protein